MLAYKSATELIDLMRRAELSAEELLLYLFKRIDRYNPSLNAIIYQRREEALTRARRGIGALAGLPVTVKEAFDWKGSPSTWGMPELKNNRASQNSVVVDRLLTQGAALFGKTNVPIRLGDFQTYNDIYGETLNPWDHTRTPGGSSGGSAVALATGMTCLEMGSDIGGSIRNPAHFCGVFGHKPSWSLIPQRGHGLPGTIAAPDISVVGPLARSATDLELALKLLIGPDELSTATHYRLPHLGERQLSDLRVAVWANEEVAPVSQTVEKRVLDVAQRFRDAGARVDENARPAFHSRETQYLYDTLVQAQLGALESPQAQEQELGQVAKLDSQDHSEAACTLRAKTIRHFSWWQLHDQRHKYRWHWHDFFKSFDVLLTPVMATSAFPIDRRPFNERTLLVDGKEQPYFQQVFWSGLSSVCYLPSTVLPAGLDEEGLPLGVQLIGPEYGDLITIGVAKLLEREGLAFQPPPLFSDE